jgi:hypothetical protein
MRIYPDNATCNNQPRNKNASSHKSKSRPGYGRLFTFLIKFNRGLTGPTADLTGSDWISLTGLVYDHRLYGAWKNSTLRGLKKILRDLYESLTGLLA